MGRDFSNGDNHRFNRTSASNSVGSWLLLLMGISLFLGAVRRLQLSWAITVQRTTSHVSSGETGHLHWHQPAGPQEIWACSSAGLLRCSLTQAILFGGSLVLSLVCVLLKLPFPQLIIRMGFGRANRAPVGRVPLPCREGYEKGQDHRFLQQDQGENKKNQAHTRISTLNCCYAQLGLGEPSAYFRPELLSHSIFHRVLQIRENECRIFLICLYFNFCPYDLVTYLLFINSYGCSSLLWLSRVYIFCV